MAELDPRDLIDLIDRYFDEEDLDEKSQAQLQAHLCENAEARTLFIEMATVRRCWREWTKFETELRDSRVPLPDAEESRRLDEEVWQGILADSFVAKKRAELGQEDQQPFEEGRPQRSPHPLPGKQQQSTPRHVTIVIPRAVAWGAIAACMLLAAWVLLSFLDDSQDAKPGLVVAPPASIEQKPLDQLPFVAYVKDARLAKWLDAEQAPDEAGQMRPGRYTLEQGAVSVVLARGTNLVIQSPAAFVILDDNRIQLETGRLVARVPQQSAGFTVQVHGLRLIDIGTEFGVDVNESGQVLASTFEGMVVVREAKDSGSSVMLAGGEEIVIARGTPLEQIQKRMADRSAMVFARTLDQAGDPALAYRNAILSDKPLIYWRCDEVVNGRVVNEASVEELDAVVHGPMRLASGLFGGAGQFNGDEQVQSGLTSAQAVFKDGVPASYTIEAWIKPDRIHRGSIAALFDQSQLLAQPLGTYIDMQPVITDDRELVPDRVAFRFQHLTTSPDLLGRTALINEQVTYQPNTWMHVVAVQEPGTIHLYINGNLVQQASYLAEEEQGQQQWGPLDLAIGNTGVGIQLNQSNFRTFSGLIDEVALYHNALSPERIRHHYNLGEPQQK